MKQKLILDCLINELSISIGEYIYRLIKKISICICIKEKYNYIINESFSSLLYAYLAFVYILNFILFFVFCLKISVNIF